MCMYCIYIYIYIRIFGIYGIQLKRHTNCDCCDCSIVLIHVYLSIIWLSIGLTTLLPPYHMHWKYHKALRILHHNSSQFSLEHPSFSLLFHTLKPVSQILTQEHSTCSLPWQSSQVAIPVHPMPWPSVTKWRLPPLILTPNPRWIRWIWPSTRSFQYQRLGRDQLSIKVGIGCLFGGGFNLILDLCGIKVWLFGGELLFGSFFWGGGTLELK